MGSSFVNFKGSGYWSPDAPLEVWLRFLADKVRDLPSADPWLREIGEYWHTQSGVGFIGCVNAGLDDYVTDEKRIETVIALCYSVLQDMKQNVLLTKEKLNALHIGGGGNIFLSDVPTEFYVKQGAAFIALLSGQISTTSKTASPEGPNEADIASTLDDIKQHSQYDLQ